ncbi:MAG: MFS transporter [Xanthobacteraceae bacterium]
MLGAFADRHGRKKAFMLTIALMMFGTAIIAVLPTYAVIGPLAPFAIVVARLIQGISAGGGFGSATAFLAEQDTQRRGFLASWQFASQGLTTVIAAASGAVLTGVLTTEQIDAWGWRVPFIFGLLIGPVVYYLGRHADETAEFKSLHVSAKPFLDALAGAKMRECWWPWAPSFSAPFSLIRRCSCRALPSASSACRKRDLEGLGGAAISIDIVAVDLLGAEQMEGCFIALRGDNIPPHRWHDARNVYR